MKDASALRHQDRRLKVRHKAHCLRVTINPKGFLSRFRQAMPARCIDINRYGVAIETDQKFRAGERISLNFRGPYISESRIDGIVASVTKSGDRFRYGICFAYCTDSKMYSREVDNALSRIETLCSQLQPEA